MKNLTLPIALLAGFATVAIAHEEAKDPTVKARMALMQEVRQATATVGGMAQGKIAFDAEQAAAAKETLIEAAGKIPAAFEEEATDPKSEALPVIWTDWDGFTEKAVALETAAEALDTASLDTLRAGMPGVGQSCGGCHKGYRMDK